MPFAMNGETPIRYEVEGDGEPLVMVHPGTVDLEMWRADERHDATACQRLLDGVLESGTFDHSEDIIP